MAHHREMNVNCYLKERTIKVQGHIINEIHQCRGCLIDTFGPIESHVGRSKAESTLPIGGPGRQRRDLRSALPKQGGCARRHEQSRSWERRKSQTEKCREGGEWSDKHKSDLTETPPGSQVRTVSVPQYWGYNFNARLWRLFLVPELRNLRINSGRAHTRQ